MNAPYPVSGFGGNRGAGRDPQWARWNADPASDADALNGGAGDDVLHGGAGAQILRGGADDDLPGADDATEWTPDQHTTLDPLVTAYWRQPPPIG